MQGAVLNVPPGALVVRGSLRSHLTMRVSGPAQSTPLILRRSCQLPLVLRCFAKRSLEGSDAGRRPERASWSPRGARRASLGPHHAGVRAGASPTPPPDG